MDDILKRLDKLYGELIASTIYGHHAHTVAEARIEIERALRPEVAAWISVEDRLPEGDMWIEVLTFDREGLVSIAEFWPEKKEFWPVNGNGEYWSSRYDDITHWKPIDRTPPQGER